MSGFAATAILLFTVFAARTYIAGLDYSRALRSHGRPGLLGFDEDLARRYGARPIEFLKDAIVTSSFREIRRHHAEPDLERRRIDYVIGVVGMIVSLVLIWPLW